MSVESPPIMSTPLRRLDHIQALRGIAALMVVVSHLLIIEKKYSADQILGEWANFGMAGVDLFFVISGFIMVYVMWDRPRGPRAAAKFMWGRAARIYPLYWIVSLVLLALWFVRPDMVFSSIEGKPNFLRSFLLFPDAREPLLAVGWTLVHEMYFYLVFAGIMLLPRGFLFPSLIIWAFLIFIGNAIEKILGHGGVVTQLVFSPLTLEFIGGAMAAWIFKTRRHSPTTEITSVLPNIVLAIGILLLVIKMASGGAFPNENQARIIVFAIPCVMIVYGLAARDWADGKIWKPLVTLGDWSYALYLTHVLSLTVMGRVWENFNADSLLDNFAVLIAMTAVTIFISGLVYRYIERPILKAVRPSRKS